MSTNMSTIAGALKRVYGNYVSRLQNLEHRAMDEIAKTARKYNPGGAGFYGAINDYGNESIGAINETEQFRSIDNENYQQFVVSPKVLVAPIEFSGLVSKAADQDEEAFVSIVVDALDRSRERLLKDENRQFYGSGSGSLALVAANASIGATQISVDSAQYLRANMVIDSDSGLSGARVSQVDKIANVVYLAAPLAVALSIGDKLVKQNILVSAPSDGKEMMGLRGICDDGTELATFQGLSVSANQLWRGRRIDAGVANLTSDLLQRLIDDVAVLSGEEPDTLIMHRKQRRKYLDIVTPEKRFMDLKLDAGFQKLSFNGMDLWLDVDCQDDRVYAITKKLIEKFELAPMEMGSHDGSDKFLRASNFDKFQAYWRHYCNFGTSKRNAHGVLVNLAKPSGAA